MPNLADATRTVTLLGGSKTLQLKGTGPLAWVVAIRKGFPIAALDSFRQNIDATNAELAQALGTSVRSLAGRRHKGVLSASESERLLRLAKVVVRAESVFDDVDNGLNWLREPNISLGGEPPISLLDTDIGTELVRDVLGRIERGVFA